VATSAGSAGRGPVAGTPSLNDDAPQSDAEALENVVKAFPTATAPTENFKACERCGTLKDKWVPPGTSKAGKPYAGFYSCRTTGTTRSLDGCKKDCSVSHT